MLSDKDIIVFPPRWQHYKRDSWNLLFDPGNMIWIKVNQDAMEIIEILEKNNTIEKTISQISLLLPNDTKGNIHSIIQPLVSGLVEVGFLHKFQYRKVFLRPNYLEVPKNIYMMMTYQCNLNCLYCSNYLDRRKFTDEKNIIQNTELNNDEYKQLINDSKKLGVRSFIFTGGEPLLNPNTLFTAKYVKELGMRTELITNGLLIEKENVSDIANLFDNITVSLDSMNRDSHERMRGTGTFDKVVTSIKLLKNQGAKVRINSVISHVNASEIFEIHQYVMNELKCDDFSPSLYSPTNSKKLEYKKFLPKTDELLWALEKMRKHTKKFPYVATSSAKTRLSCGVANGEISIAYDGNVYPCHLLHKAEFKCGNIKKQQLGVILEESELIKNLRTFDITKIEDCKECDFKYFCGGGCLAMTYNLYGDIYKKRNFYCEYLKREYIERMWASTDHKTDASRIT